MLRWRALVLMQVAVGLGVAIRATAGGAKWRSLGYLAHTVGHWRLTPLPNIVVEQWQEDGTGVFVEEAGVRNWWVCGSRELQCFVIIFCRSIYYVLLNLNWLWFWIKGNNCSHDSSDSPFHPISTQLEVLLAEIIRGRFQEVEKGIKYFQIYFWESCDAWWQLLWQYSLKISKALQVPILSLIVVMESDWMIEEVIQRNIGPWYGVAIWWPLIHSQFQMQHLQHYFLKISMTLQVPISSEVMKWILIGGWRRWCRGTCGHNMVLLFGGHWFSLCSTSNFLNNNPTRPWRRFWLWVFPDHDVDSDWEEKGDGAKESRVMMKCCFFAATDSSVVPNEISLATVSSKVITVGVMKNVDVPQDFLFCISKSGQAKISFVMIALMIFPCHSFNLTKGIHASIPWHSNSLSCHIRSGGSIFMASYDYFLQLQVFIWSCFPFQTSTIQIMCFLPRSSCLWFFYSKSLPHSPSNNCHVQTTTMVACCNSLPSISHPQGYQN